MAAGNDTRAGVARRLSVERGRGGKVEVLLDGVRIGGIVSHGGSRPWSTVFASRIYGPFGKVEAEGTSVRSVMAKVAHAVSAALRAGAEWTPPPSPGLRDALELIASAAGDPCMDDVLETAHRENDLLEGFLHGRCHQLAVAMHEATGLPIHAYLDGDGEGRAFLLHAFVLDGDMAVDAKGRRPLDGVLADFDACDPDCGRDGPQPMTADEAMRWGGGRRAPPAAEMAEARAVASALAAALATAPAGPPAP